MSERRQVSAGEWVATSALSVPAALWRFRWLVVLGGVIGAVIGLAVAVAGGEKFAGEANVVLAEPRGDFQQEVLQLSRDPNRHTRNVSAVLDSAAVAERAAELLDGRYSVRAIRDAVSASPVPGQDIVQVRAVRVEPAEAIEIADAVTAAYRELAAESARVEVDEALVGLIGALDEASTRLDEVQAAIEEAPRSAPLLAQRAALRDEVSELETRITRLDLEATLWGSGLQQVQPAVAVGPLSRNRLVLAFIGAVLGIGAGGAAAWSFAEARPVVGRRQEAEDELGAPLLGEVPAASTEGGTIVIATAASPESRAARAYDYALSALRLALQESKARTVAFATTERAETSAAAVLNLAVAAASGGLAPVVVDGNERDRVVTVVTGASGERGLRALGAQDESVSDCVEARPIDGTVISVIGAPAAGTAEPGFFRAASFRTAVGKLRESAELAFFDTPPALASAEALDICAEADGIVVVVAAGTRLRKLRDLRDRMALTGIPVVGFLYAPAGSGSWGGRRWGRRRAAAEGAVAGDAAA